MTTFPRQPAAAAGWRVAKTVRDTARAHARLDQVTSIQSQITAEIGAVSGGTGGTAAQNFLGLLAVAAAASTQGGDSAQAAFLGNLAKMSHLGSPSSSASHSGIGTITGTPTDTEFNALNTAYNNAADVINALATLVASLLSELQSDNFMS